MEIEHFIRAAIEEDIGAGDHTSLACIPEARLSKAEIIARGNGVIAGIEIARKVFEIIDPDLAVEPVFRDGDMVEREDMVMLIRGRARSILKAERVVLNFMQRMSGISTLTRKYVKAVEGFPVKILDTRKTTPLFREFEKLAVKIGGGENHRMGLYDMIMIKDNHIAYAGGIKPAIQAVRHYLEANNLSLKIEIETSSLEEVQEVIATGGVHRIMLDNFKIPVVKKAVKLINKSCEIEVSGGITLESVRDYAACGVDYISVGALTHSYKSLDLSLEAI
ncbi:MAG: nicotinate-nucleotide diphosphorylase (carboxylating) [Chitinophagales bacterium]|nr:MAG: nicotinate-nucleotide diphosphorylase (carboxylating) [Chitinophagales bacterium]